MQIDRSTVTHQNYIEPPHRCRTRSGDKEPRGYVSKITKRKAKLNFVNCNNEIRATCAPVDVNVNYDSLRAFFDAIAGPQRCDKYSPTSVGSPKLLHLETISFCALSNMNVSALNRRSPLCGWWSLSDGGRLVRFPVS